MQRVEHPDQFARELDQPLEGGKEVTEADLEEDAAAFVAFTGALGIAPPGQGDGNGGASPLRSASSA